MFRYLPLALLALALLPLATPTANADERPNILLVLSDDLSWRDIGCYGSVNVKTPNLDQLADDGIRFSRFYNSIAMCAPTRCMLYTGIYPVKNGSCRNHSGSKEGVKSIFHYLPKLGYRTALAGKSHVRPKSVFPYDFVQGLTPGCCSATDNYSLEHIEQFINTEKEKPFCLVTAFIQPHVPWTVGDASAYSPEKLVLPDHWADTPETRDAYSRYLAEITFFDKQLGELLAVLEKSGRAKNTLVLYLSEQGAQFPGAKWTSWDEGIHAAAIARWPAKIKKGEVCDAIVQYVDVAPTFIELAGGKPAKAIEGKSFVKLLEDPKLDFRQFAYAIHCNTPEGPPYPVRAIIGKEYKYIWNTTPEATYIEKHVVNPKAREVYWQSWLKSAQKGDKRSQRAIQRWQHRPEEELYQILDDPFEKKNLAANPELKEVKQKLRTELQKWMKEQGDDGSEFPLRNSAIYLKKSNYINNKKIKKK